ncbi:hypothetical protein [Dishui Lake large algae virus 1]|nr:hypothetical protein [Dishui Lake large algae virus 1]
MPNLLPAEGYFWCEREEEYLQLLQKTCLELSEVYRLLYISTSKIQNKLRLPAIILSSLSGAASFGSASFAEATANPARSQNYISISIGIVNVFIAMIQTYESFKKIADTVSKSISTSTALKKLSEDIHCMVFIPTGDRDTAGIMYLRDAFNRYQSIMDQAPPLEHATNDHLHFKDISNRITLQIRKQDKAISDGLNSPGNDLTNRNKSNSSYVSTHDRDKDSNKKYSDDIDEII